MPPEKARNVFETTVDSSYTSGTTTLVLADATGLPTTGPFRLWIDNGSNTVWRVDTRSGVTMTGAAEENDANANVGDTVRLVLSRQSYERVLQSPDSSGLHLPTGVDGASFYGPLIWPVAPVVAADYSWVNQGGATETVTRGTARLVVPAQTQNIRARMRTLSSGETWELIANPGLRTTGNADEGIIFRESGTDKWLAIRLGEDGQIYVTNYTAANNISSNLGSQPLAISAFARNPYVAGLLFFRLALSGGNVVASSSPNGITWEQLHSEAQTSSFTTAPNQVGYFVNDRSNAVAQEMTVLSFRSV